VRAVVVIALLAVGCGGGPNVVARDDSGGVVAKAALPDDGRFALAYRHSVYRAPAEERFRATSDGFVLDSIASPNAAVLDYYELEGVRTRERGWWVLKPDHPASFETMPLAATRRGQRTLVTGHNRLPLYGHAVHLRLAVEGT
jgi:hypothetical protein